jgi:hypothetical protein
MFDVLLIPVTADLDQVKVAPGVALVGVYVNGVPLQTAGGVSVLLKVGRGKTVMLMLLLATVTGFTQVLVLVKLQVMTSLLAKFASV